MTEPVYIDATMLYRWRHLAPVGIVRLERVLAAHLRFHSSLTGNVHYVLWESGYRPAEPPEIQLLDELLGQAERPTDTGAPKETSEQVGTPIAVDPGARRGVKATVRRLGMRGLARFPDHLRPFAEQAAWSTATLAVETARSVRRARARQTVRVRPGTSDRPVTHHIDLSRGGDLVALGLGWEYLDHVAMYRLKHEHGIRIHMPAFDLIPVLMPQMNAAQSDLVHRYYAEMAHYADTITCISHATESSMRAFYEDEQLPVPALVTNSLPAVELRRSDRGASAAGVARHRLEGRDFVLSVSTVEIRKNHLLLAKIWTECIREGVDLPVLAIVGRIGWDVHELMRWVDHAPELRDRVAIHTDVEDDELAEMYTDAMFTVFPSRIEGWGMPITESLAAGTPCIHSNDPAQIEASQDTMPALHPDDYTAWKDAIVRAATDAAFRDELRHRIAEQYRPKSTADYCLEYERMLQARRGAR